MRQVMVLEFDLASLRRVTGGGSYARGAEYARHLERFAFLLGGSDGEALFGP